MAEVVRIKPSTDKMLAELSVKRKSIDAIARTKQDIVAELVSALYKKEMKQA